MGTINLFAIISSIDFSFVLFVEDGVLVFTGEGFAALGFIRFSRFNVISAVPTSRNDRPDF